MADETVRMVIPCDYPVRFAFINQKFVGGSGTDASAKFVAYRWEGADIAIIRNSTGIMQLFCISDYSRWINRNGT